MTENTRSESDSSGQQDVSALVQTVLRESYLEQTMQLRDYAEKVRWYNEQKKAIRHYLCALRALRAKAIASLRERGIRLCQSNQGEIAAIEKTFAELADAHDAGPIGYELCIPQRVPPPEVRAFSELDVEVARWEARLATVGDDAQLANVDLQNTLQKLQQSLQMLSNISKMLHDNAMSIIRKMGG